MYKSKKVKNTGLINFYLPKNNAPIHPYLLCALFAPTLARTKNKETYFKANNSVWRFYKHTDDFSVKVNRDFLEMKNDFLVFSYLLMRLEKANKDTKRDQLKNYIYVNYAELTEFFNLKDTTKRPRKKIIDALERFKGTKLIINIKPKDKNESEFIIPNLVEQIDNESKQQRYRISFPSALFKLYFEVNRVALIDFDKFQNLKTEFARKLYVYFRTVDVRLHKYETLKKLLGHYIVESDKNNTYENVIRNTCDTKFSSNLNKAFIELYNQNIITNHPSEFKKKKDVYKITYVARNNNDILTEKEKDQLQEENAQFEREFHEAAEIDRVCECTVQGEPKDQDEYEQYHKDQEKLLNMIDSIHQFRGVDWQDL